MKKRFLVFIILATFMLSNISGFSQDSLQNYGIAIVPHTLIFSGIRLDFDKRIKNTNAWLSLCPQFYFNERDLSTTDYNDNRTYQRLIGFGGDAYAKYFFSKTKMPEGVYLGIGLNYNHFRIKYPEYQWTTYTKDGLQFIENKLVTENETINRFGGNLIIGLQFKLVDNMFGDIYLGYGTKYSVKKTEGNSQMKKFTEYMWDYAYSGVAIAFGFRLGVLF